MDFHNVPRGPPGGQARCGGEGQYHYGEARRGLWRCDYQGPGGGAGAGGLLQRQRRVHHGEVCGPGRGPWTRQGSFSEMAASAFRAGSNVFDLFCPGTGPFFGRREAGLIDTLCTAFEEAKRYIPGGVNSPVRAFAWWQLPPVHCKSRRGLPDRRRRKPLYRLCIAPGGP